MKIQDGVPIQRFSKRERNKMKCKGKMAWKLREV